LVLQSIREVFPTLSHVSYEVNRLLKAVREVGVWLDSGGVPLYSCRFSKRVFTQHQHVKCLVLKTVFRLRYRELVELLEVSDKLVRKIGLKRIPHFTTLQKFAARFPCWMLDGLITLIAKHVCGGVFDVAIDSTGYSLDTSSYDADSESACTRIAMQFVVPLQQAYRQE